MGTPRPDSWCYMECWCTSPFVACTKVCLIYCHLSLPWAFKHSKQNSSQYNVYQNVALYLLIQNGSFTGEIQKCISIKVPFLSSWARWVQKAAGLPFRFLDVPQDGHRPPHEEQHRFGPGLWAYDVWIRLMPKLRIYWTPTKIIQPKPILCSSGWESSRGFLQSGLEKNTRYLHQSTS